LAIATEETIITFAEISKMSVLERIQAMEALWDSLDHESVGFKPAKWHKGMLSERRQIIQSGNAHFISLEELKSKHKK